MPSLPEPNDRKAAAERIQALQRQIDELKKSWPAHSVPASLLVRLEELEEELERALKENGG